MTIRNRLARSNIAMLVIPILAAALLLLLGLGGHSGRAGHDGAGGS